MKDNYRDDDYDRRQRRSQAQEGTQNDTPHRRKDPYKRDRVDYNDYLQEADLEDEWFEQNN